MPNFSVLLFLIQKKKKITDRETPVISSTARNITVNTDPGFPFAVVTWDAVTASDNSGSATLTSNFQSGDKFPIGNTIVVYNATDPNGNSATAKFKVTVNGTREGQ